MGVSLLGSQGITNVIVPPGSGHLSSIQGVTDMPIFNLRPHRVAAGTAGALLAALLTAGCHNDNPPANTVVTTPAPAPAVAPSATTTTTPGGTAATTPDTKINTNAGAGTSNGTDTATADQINTAIVHNKQMTGSRVEPVVTGGVATLNGQVQNQQQKALAETTARQVPGVSSIKNKLIIVTTGGAKPKPTVITKTKTVYVHDKAAPADSGASGGTSDTQAPAPPAAPDAPAAPATPDNSANTGTTNP